MVKKIVQRVIVGVLVSIILTFIFSFKGSAIGFNSQVDIVTVHPVTWQCIARLKDNTNIVVQNGVNIPYANGTDTPTSKIGLGLTSCQTKESNINIKEGHYYQITANILRNTIKDGGVAIPWTLIDNQHFSIVSINEVVNDQTLVDYQATSTYEGSINMVRKTYEFILKAKTDYNNGRVYINDPNKSSFLILGDNFNTNIVYFNEQIIEFKVSSSTTEYMEQDKTENQQQGEQSQTDADSTNQQTEENTQNLLGFLTSFFGAFTSAQATNCNMDWGLSQYGFGVIDMCSTQIPATFSVILSIITLLMVLPMILWLINSIIKAFKEFQE